MTVPSHPDRRQQLAELRRQIRALDVNETAPASLAAGSEQIVSRDAARCGDHPLELAPGLHEICPAGYLDTPAALAVQAGLMATHLRATRKARGRQERPVLWVRRAMGTGQDFGRPYPPALAQWGLDPARLILVETSSETDTLWTLEEGLKTGAVVIGETGPSARYDLVATRRLDQAARRIGALALVLRPHEGLAPSAALSRWRIAARPSPARAWIGARGLPGLGEPRFHAALERVRGGPPQEYEIEWKHASFHVLEPAPLADRPASPERDTERDIQPDTRPGIVANSGVGPALAGQLIRLTG